MNLIRHIMRQRQWSRKTFGTPQKHGDRTKGILDHIRKELQEIEQDPKDLSEWIDVVILALDGAWRNGHTPEAIAQALHDKQVVNEAREWPPLSEQQTGRAIEHMRENYHEH